MCGMRSMRRKGSTGLRRGFAGDFENGFTHRAASTMAFRMTSGLCTLPPAWGTGMTLARPAACALHFVDHLAQVQLRHDEGFDAAGQLADVLLGERPRGDDAELAGANALGARQLGGALGDARGDAVGDHHHFGVVQVHGFEEGAAVGERLQLVLQAAHQLVLRLDVHAGVAALVVREAGDVEAVAVAGLHHVGDQVFAWARRGGTPRATW